MRLRCSTRIHTYMTCILINASAERELWHQPSCDLINHAVCCAANCWVLSAVYSTTVLLCCAVYYLICMFSSHLLPSESGRPQTFVQLMARWHGRARSPPRRRFPTLKPEPAPLAPGCTGSWLECAQHKQGQHIEATVRSDSRAGQSLAGDQSPRYATLRCECSQLLSCSAAHLIAMTSVLL